MKQTISVSLLAALLLAASGIAHSSEHNHAGMEAAPARSASTQQWTEGVVVKVNEKRGKVTLQHGDIPGVMPAMTMAYPVQDTQVLRSLHAGDKVRFVMKQQQDDYLITQIEPAK